MRDETFTGARGEQSRAATYRTAVVNDLLLHHEGGAAGHLPLGQVLAHHYEVGVALLPELVEAARELLLGDVAHFGQLAQHPTDSCRNQERSKSAEDESIQRLGVCAAGGLTFLVVAQLEQAKHKVAILNGAERSRHCLRSGNDG